MIYLLDNKLKETIKSSICLVWDSKMATVLAFILTRNKSPHGTTSDGLIQYFGNAFNPERLTLANICATDTDGLGHATCTPKCKVLGWFPLNIIIIKLDPPLWHLYLFYPFSSRASSLFFFPQDVCRTYNCISKVSQCVWIQHAFMQSWLPLESRCFSTGAMASSGDVFDTLGGGRALPMIGEVYIV